MSIPSKKFLFNLNSNTNSFIHKLLFHLAERCSNEVFWIRSPDYQEQIYVSPSFHKVWGCDITELMVNPESWIDTIHPEDRSHMSKSVERRNANINRDAKIIENYRIVCPDGEIKWIKDTSYPIFDHTVGLLGYAGIAQDVTADKLKEEKRQMERLINIIKVMASSMAHEIRTPLAGVKIGLTLLKKFFIQGIDELSHIFTATTKPSTNVLTQQKFQEQLAYIDKMIQRINMGQELINLQLKNMSTEKVDTQDFEYCQIRHCIQDAIDSYPFETIQQRQWVHYDDQHDFTFFGNPLLTKHIVWNLLKNALHIIKETDKGEIYITVEDKPSWHCLIFTDTSKGIAAEGLPKIFERFYTGRSDGNGLGLSFCKIIMQAYGGDIECDSQLGKFTRFTLLFPKST